MCYFPLKRFTKQGDPILTCSKCLACKNVQGQALFNNQFLYTTYADDTIFFSVMNIL